MLIKKNINYKPPVMLRNGHIQSILPSLFRKVEDVKFESERITTPDDDFLDLDWSATGNKTLAIISHGLEGNSRRSYVKGMVNALNGEGVDCLAWNYRSCSGEPNRKLRMYHNGSTDDLDLVIRHAISKEYKFIFLIGFSMGGNLSLLYLGQLGDKIYPEVKGAITFSVPIDLKNSSEQLSLFSNKIYMKRFLKMLHKKVIAKKKLFPDLINDDNYEKIKSFKEFDERYTAPIHGFKDAEDYWRKCSSKLLLGNIKIPSLIVNSADDPFLGKLCYETGEIENENILFEIPSYGGHVGFINNKINGVYWSELRAIDFIKYLC